MTCYKAVRLCKVIEAAQQSYEVNRAPESWGGEGENTLPAPQNWKGQCLRSFLAF